MQLVLLYRNRKRFPYQLALTFTISVEGSTIHCFSAPKETFMVVGITGFCRPGSLAKQEIRCVNRCTEQYSSGDVFLFRIYVCFTNPDTHTGGHFSRQCGKTVKCSLWLASFPLSDRKRRSDYLGEKQWRTIGAQ